MLDDAAYAALSARVARLGAGLTEVFAAAGVTAQVPVVGPLLGVFFASEPVTDYEGSKASAATGMFPRLMRGLLERDVAIAPGAYEILFPGLAHTDADLDRLVETAGEVVATLAVA
jgi:glutamate-1-semialdehyde 2,1-aminomutase